MLHSADGKNKVQLATKRMIVRRLLSAHVKNVKAPIDRRMGLLHYRCTDIV